MIRRQDVAVALVAALIVLAAGIVLAIRNSGEPTPPAPTASATTPPATPSPAAASPSPSPSPSMGSEQALALLGDVDAAAAAEPAEVLRAGLVAGQGPWRQLAAPAWSMRSERPVYVGRARLEGSTVTADLLVVQRIEEAATEIVLRLLPAAIEDNGLEVTSTVDGARVPARHDPDGLLHVDLGDPRTGGSAVAVRLELSYDLTGTTSGGSGPAAYGILARAPGISALGHWLPVLTFEPEPLVPWGDVGSFPPAVWSVEVEHAGTLVTGGDESPCPGEPRREGCTWARGLALRDLSAVVFGEGREVETVAAGLGIRAIGGADIALASLETALDEAEASAEGFIRRFGPLAWRQLDVVAVPLGQGAAGMEFPGLVMVDDELYGSFSGGFGTYVLVHEVAHQWFHALVGNRSLADPVVDEPLAQYLSVLAYRDLFGPDAARALADDTMAERYRRFRQSGLEEEAPAQHSGDFEGPGTYGPLIYARAPLAWLAAEDAIGSAAVEAFVAGLVDRYGLDVLSAEQLLDEAAATDADLARILERYWYDPEPVTVP